MKLHAAVLAAAAIAITCCSPESDESGGGETSVTELIDPRDALGEDLMVALAQAKNFHHKADVYLKDARLDDAIASVRQILAIRFPDNAPEAEDVILDARARLAKLLVTSGAIEEAMVVVDHGLRDASRDSFFVANLHTVRGEVWEARALRSDEAGENEAARASRHQAIEAFDRAIQINEALLESLVKERR
jgi:tetratricopeptide (TPR) repeat protein